MGILLLLLFIIILFSISLKRYSSKLATKCKIAELATFILFPEFSRSFHVSHSMTPSSPLHSQLRFADESIILIKLNV